MIQVRALRAVQQAGFEVPESVRDKMKGYLKKATTPTGGVAVSPQHPGQETLFSTFAALAATFNPGDYQDPLARKWLRYCQPRLRFDLPDKPDASDSYTHYHLAQILYGLGDRGYARLFPDAKPDQRLTWGRYRKATFTRLIKAQKEDGRWEFDGDWSGPAGTTALYLSILQLDNATLPIYQRGNP
jgi:hypothetical protein